MNKSALLILAAGLLLPVLPVHAASVENDLVILDGDSPFNVATVEMVGNGNRLTIVQEYAGNGGSNLIEASITGDDNGGPIGSSFTSAPLLQSGLKPGTLTQTGFDNEMTITVEGSHNLFAFAQTGSGNRLTASITGFANQAAVIQRGVNNHAGFSQTGTGNMVSITQISW